MFDAFYEDYVTACAEAAIEPLSSDQLLALVQALLQARAAALSAADYSFT